ncbi:MAG: GtrA family protein [Flavobacteriales bacterium]|nr:GtrA family protein [Flavobacteriales bacterium]
MQRNLRQIIAFVIIGALSAVVEVVTFKLFILPNAFPSVFSFENDAHFFPISSLASSACGILFNYILSIKFVFKQGKHSKNKEFTYFIALSLFSMIMTWVVGFSLKQIITFDFIFSSDIICKILAIGIVSVLNYIVKKKFIFHN